MFKTFVDICSKCRGNVSLKYLQRRSQPRLDMMRSGYINDVNVKPPNIIDKVDEVDLSRKSSHTTTHLNFTSLFLSFPAPTPLPS